MFRYEGRVTIQVQRMTRAGERDTGRRCVAHVYDYRDWPIGLGNTRRQAVEAACRANGLDASNVRVQDVTGCNWRRGEFRRELFLFEQTQTSEATR